MNDIGVSCHKDSYGRGVGKVLTCTSEQEYDAGLCYTPCEYQADGVGPVCWGHCPAGTKPCGDLLCLDEVEECTAYILEDTAEGVKIVLDIATANPFGTVIDTSKLVTDLVYPECATWY